MIYQGKFDANKDYFTHTEWVKAGTGFGFVMGILIGIKIFLKYV